MNTVMLEVRVPDALWVRGKITQPKDGDGLSYAARFCKSSERARKVLHNGPVVDVVVMSGNPVKELSRKSYRLQIDSAGELTLENAVERFEEAQADIEKEST
jgi:hypothetical protein